MKITRIAAMFKTFGLEDKLSQSFKQHYKRMLREMKDPSVRRKYQRLFFKDKEIYLGSANLSELLAPIVEHYGQPKYLPKRIKFIIVRDDHPINAEGGANAFFSVGDDGTYTIIKVAMSFSNIEFDSAFEDTIAHETQHFLKSLYQGEIPENYAEAGAGQIAQYYGDEWEIQAYSTVIVRHVIESLTTYISMGIEGKSKERTDVILNSMERNKMDLLSSFLIRAVNDFFKQVEERTGDRFSPELRKEYYKHTYRDFNTSFSDMIASFKS